MEEWTIKAVVAGVYVLGVIITTRFLIDKGGGPATSFAIFLWPLFWTFVLIVLALSLPVLLVMAVADVLGDYFRKGKENK